MIAQARITSDTRATVYLADDTVELAGEDLPDLRTQIKQVFIGAARRSGDGIDIAIVEPDARHHLRVEPSGRIASRPADDRPLYGPEDSTPAPLASPSDASWAPSSGLAPREGAGSVTPRRHRGAHSAASASWGRTSGVSAAVSSGASGHSPSSALSAASASSAPSSRSPEHADGPELSDDDTRPADAPGDADTATGQTPETPQKPERNLPTADQTDPSRPTLQDLQSTARTPKKVPATKGLPGFITRVTGGVISPRPNRTERHERDRAERLRRPVDGPRNIAVVNLKGGAHKTTATLMLAATLGVARGGSVLAWDNNETRGTLGWRGVPSDHHRTALDLLHDLDQLRSPQASVADLDRYVRHQGVTRFDILASDEDPGSAASIDGRAFEELDETLSRFYRLKVIDTGNNVRASNWLAAVRSADQLVIISTVREDTFNAAAWMIDELRATGLGSQVDNAVTILSHSAKGKIEATLRRRLMTHFGAHTRAIAEVPYEEAFVDGSHLEWDRITPATKEAWMEATALVVDGL